MGFWNWLYRDEFHSRTHLVIYNIVIGLVRTGSDFDEGDITNIRSDNWKKLEKGDLTPDIFHLIFKNFNKF